MSEAERKNPGQIARQWWRNLQPAPDRGRPGDRPALARLRRCDAASAIMEEATLKLFRALEWRNPERLPRVATLACVLAHVRAESSRPFGSAIGRTSIDDKQSAVMSVLRFQRLLQSQGEDEIERSFRRAVTMLGGEANVADLSNIILYFEYEERRRRLAYQYYAADGAAPKEEEAADPEIA